MTLLEIQVPTMDDRTAVAAPPIAVAEKRARRFALSPKKMNVLSPKKKATAPSPMKKGSLLWKKAALHAVKPKPTKVSKLAPLELEAKLKILDTRYGYDQPKPEVTLLAQNARKEAIEDKLAEAWRRRGSEYLAAALATRGQSTAALPLAEPMPLPVLPPITVPMSANSKAKTESWLGDDFSTPTLPSPLMSRAGSSQVLRAAVAR